VSTLIAVLCRAVALATLLAAAIAALAPQQKAALLVVSGVPAPHGVGGVLVRRGQAAGVASPTLVFVDQEGGLVQNVAGARPLPAAASYTSSAQAYRYGLATATTLRARGIRVDLAPVVDFPDGPLGSRHFRRPEYAAAFAKGLSKGGVAACAKHFPGLGTAGVSTDERPHVDARTRPTEVAAFRTLVRAGVPCVMTSNAFYDGAPFRASISARTYRLLRAQGFDGVAISDSLSIVRDAPVERWARSAVRAGADLVLFTSPAHARRAIAALIPLARSGELDTHVARVLAFQARYG
jgi:beta-N-acetylhexosaminidase